jgi:hypothetical protein
VQEDRNVTDPHTLMETERAMRRHVADLDLHFEAAHAVSSIYRAANAIRMHLTNKVLRPYDITWTGFRGALGGLDLGRAWRPGEQPSRRRSPRPLSPV